MYLQTKTLGGGRAAASEEKMRILRAIALSLSLILCFGLAGWAQKDKLRGGGEETTPVTITFANAGADRITSDVYGAYINGQAGVEAFIGSKANLGNLFLRLLNSPVRTLKLDFRDCISIGECKPPAQDVQVPVFLKADVNETLSGGMLAMNVGDRTTAPMRIRFLDDDPEGPWFVNFDPSIRSCRGSDMVTVERNSSTTWTVSAGGIACLSASGKTGQSEFRGRYNLPFSLTVVLK
jgi:hypothetical protein